MDWHIIGIVQNAANQSYCVLMPSL